MKTSDFKSYQQAFSPSTTDPIDFAELEVECTLLVSTGQLVSNSKFPVRNTYVETRRNAVKPICKRNSSMVSNIQVVRFEK